MSNVNKIVNILSTLGKQKDTAQVLRDLEEVEKSVMYVRKIVLRRINVAKNVKAVERNKIVTPSIADAELAREGE